MKNTITPEQLDALRKFAGANGRTWKAELNHLWMTGTWNRAVMGGADSMHLQQLRNQEGFGPRGLVRFSLAKAIAAVEVARG